MPETYEDTIKIKGVGEKMALLYMQIAFNETLGIAVDVNIIRVVSRIGLSYEKSPSKIRRDLESMIDKDKWSEVNQLLVGFG